MVVGRGREAGLNGMGVFLKHLTLRGGGAPARAYMEDLMADVLAGKLDPSPDFDMTVALEGIPDGYAAMNNRKALKVLIRIQRAAAGTQDESNACGEPSRAYQIRR